MKTKKTLIIILIVALLSGLAYAGVQSQKDSATDRTENFTKNNGVSKKDKVEKNTKSTPKGVEDKPLTEADERGEDPTKQPSTNSQSGSISISTAQDVGDAVIVRTVVNKITSGECMLKATNGGKTITKSAQLGLVTNYYTCQGFDINKDELGAGTWSVSVSVGNISSGITKVDVK